MSDVIRTQVSDGVGIITLNRPAVKNALNLELRTALQDAVESMDASREVHVFVLTGAGGTFCAGRDLTAAQAGEPIYRNRQEAARSFQRSGARKPVIAAVEGYALGGGFELALSCDLIVAAETARFGLPEVKRNVVAIGGGLIRLPLRVPYHLAMTWALTGEMISPATLAQWGVVTEVAEDGGALDAALRLSARISANGPSAVRATKEIIRNCHEWAGEDEAWDAQMAIAEPALTSPDRDEGIRAFFEKRDPVWTDV